MDQHSTLLPSSDAAATQPAGMGRRGLFRLGGLGAVAAVLAACGQSEAGELGTLGNGPGTPELPAGTVDNGALLRTSASIETSIANAYQRMMDDGLFGGSTAAYPDLGDPMDLVMAFLDHHRMAADTYNELAVGAGDTAWTCGNQRLDEQYIDIVLSRITDGVPAAENAAAIPASDDPLRDAVNLVYVLESLSASSAQALVDQVTEPAMRAASMKVGVRSGRDAAALALRANPGGYLPVSGDAAEIPAPVAVPSRFGSVGANTFLGGAGDENGVRLRLAFETPSLNSMVYSFTEYGDCAPVTDSTTPTT